MTEDKLRELRIAIKKALRDELLHPYLDDNQMEAYRAIERAMSVVDRVLDRWED